MTPDINTVSTQLDKHMLDMLPRVDRIEKEYSLRFKMVQDLTTEVHGLRSELAHARLELKNTGQVIAGLDKRLKELEDNKPKESIFNKLWRRKPQNR